MSLPLHKTLGERLRMARYAARLTQQQLAGKDFSKSYISAVERSKMTPSIPALRMLAERLGVPLAYLLGEQEAVSTPERPPGTDEFTRRLAEAEKLLRHNDPHAALERLGSEEAAAAFGAVHQACWSWLYSWALLQQHREQDMQVVLERGLEAARASQDRRAEGYLHLTRADAAARHDGAAAEQAYKQTIDLGEQVNDNELLGSVHAKYAKFLADQSRHQEAYEQMQLAQAASARAGSGY